MATSTMAAEGKGNALPTFSSHFQQDSFHLSKDFWNPQDSESLNQLINSGFLPQTPGPNTSADLNKVPSEQHHPHGSPSSPPPSSVATVSVSTTSVSSSGVSPQSSIYASTLSAAQNFPGIGPAVLPSNPAATLPPALASIPAIQNLHARILSGASLPSLSSSSSSSGSTISLASLSNHTKDLMKVDKEPTYVDVTPYLILPQHEAARRLGIPCSTLSKRWKEASLNRKWPYRIVCKLDKEITTLLKNVENSQNGQAVSMSPAVEETLALLLRKRQEELRAVVIRLC